MHPPKETAPAGIELADLKHISRAQAIRELTLPLPWLLLSWGLYSTSLWPLGALASFMYFLCALRLNHEAIHGNLGLSRAQDLIVLHILSAMICGSNSSVAWSHMRHHKHAMGPGDIEGHCGEMTAWEVLQYGPKFPFDLLRTAWRNGGTKWQNRIIRDLICMGMTVSIMLASGLQFLMLHVLAMCVAQCLTAFFAVWITHQGTGDSGLAARSQRGPLAKLAYLMFYHREHHLFPQIPVSNLPALADRLDHKVPGYAASRKPVVPFLDRRVNNQ